MYRRQSLIPREIAFVGVSLNVNGPYRAQAFGTEHAHYRMGTVAIAGKMTERKTDVMVLYLHGGNRLKRGQICRLKYIYR